MPPREDMLPPFSGWKTVARIVFIPKYTAAHLMTRAQYIYLQRVLTVNAKRQSCK